MNVAHLLRVFKKGYTYPIYMHPCYCLLLHIPHLHTHATCIYIHTHNTILCRAFPCPEKPMSQLYYHHNQVSSTTSFVVTLPILRFHFLYMYIHIYLPILCVLYIPFFSFSMIYKCLVRTFLTSGQNCVNFFDNIY